MDSDFDDPTDFQNLAFQGLDEHLRCPICKEFFETAMILATCSHTFCSLCIRRSLSAEEFCPSCRNPAIESKLHNNYVVDYLVGIWKNNRKQVLDLEKQEGESSLVRDSPMDTSSQPSANLTSLTPSRVTRSSSRRSTSQVSSAETETIIEVATETPTEVELNDDSEVDCPICMRKMELRYLNQHLDLCMQNKPDPVLDRKEMARTSELQSPKGQLLFKNPQRSASSSPIRVKNVNTGPKPKRIVYNLESQARLKKELRDLGLPDYGDKTTLIQRHKTYLSIYNANEDSLHPLDAKALRKKLAQEEEIQARGTGKKVEENDRKYESEFDSLIRAAQERKRQKEMETKQADESTSNQPTKPTVSTSLPSANVYEPVTEEQWKLLEEDSFHP